MTELNFQCRYWHIVTFVTKLFNYLTAYECEKVSYTLGILSRLVVEGECLTHSLSNSEEWTCFYSFLQHIVWTGFKETYTLDVEFG